MQPASGVPIEDLMLSIQRLGRLLASRQAASRISAAAGVDVSQQGAALLRVLLREGELSGAALAAAVPMEIAAVSRQVRLLESVGAVARTPSPDDGRVTLVALTAEGRELAERIRAVGVGHLQEALDGWSGADLGALAGLMQRLVDDLRATPVHAPGPAVPGGRRDEQVSRIGGSTPAGASGAGRARSPARAKRRTPQAPR